MQTSLSDDEVREYCVLFRRLSTCDISDAMTRLNLNAVRARGILPLVPFTKGQPHMAGPAKTMRFLPSHYKMQYQDVPLRLTEIVENAPAGSVLVVEGGDFMKPAQGEMNALTAIRAGAAGSVGDGPVRDVDALRELPLPVFYRPYPIGVTMETYVGNSLCAGVDIPVQICGALIRPGDIIVGDNNGVVTVPVEWCARVAAIAEEIGGLESEMRTRTKDGHTWRDIYATTHKSKYAGDSDVRP